MTHKIQTTLAVLFMVISVFNGMTHAAEPNDTMDKADEIAIGLKNAIIDASITSDDIDYYEFTTEANRTYVIETFDIQENISNEATGIALYAPNGTELGKDIYGNDGSNDANARITYTFVNEGKYYIMVKASPPGAWTGNYSLRILPKHDEPGADWSPEKDSEPNDERILANKIDIGLGNAQTHRLTPNTDLVSNYTDQDWYHFDAEAGNTYVIETFDIQANTSNKATTLFLYDGTGTEQPLEADRWGEGSNNTTSRIVYTFSKTGVYYILVNKENYSDWTGIYSLRVLPKYDEPGAGWDSENDDEPNDVRALSNQIEVGADKAQTHQISSNAQFASDSTDQDYYRFHATAGITYIIETFDVQENATGHGTGVYLYDETDTRLANGRSGRLGSDNVDARIEYTFTTSGTYFIQVTEEQYSGWTGTYSLRVLGEPASPDSTTDCAGVESGSAYIDNCGNCVGGTTGQSPCPLDCAGVDGGSAYLDNCNECVGGTTGRSPCVEDCNGDWGGTAYTDDCGNCVSGNTGQSPCSNEASDNEDGGGSGGGGGCYIDACAADLL